MRADELYERDLPSEIESSNQAIVASCHFEPDALTVENLGFRSRFWCSRISLPGKTTVCLTGK
jgi:hypothetical protein